jgi:hypothetical protein
MEVSGELHAPATLPPGKNPGPHWTWTWVAPTASQVVLEKRQMSHFFQVSKPRTVQHVAQSLYRLRSPGPWLRRIKWNIDPVHARKACGGCRFSSTDSSPSCFATHWTGGWVVSTAVGNFCRRETSLTPPPLPISIHDSSYVQPVA